MGCGCASAKKRPHQGKQNLDPFIREIVSAVIVNKYLILLIHGYQRFISPMLASHCRFYPTCSEYAVQALQQHNTLKAMYLILRRLFKCQPFHSGGYDPVP